MPQHWLYFHYKECRGCLEPSPCPVSSSKPCRPAKTNIGSKLLNFPGPSAPRHSQSSACSPPFPRQGPGWGGRDASPCWGRRNAAVHRWELEGAQRARGERAVCSAGLKRLWGCTQLLLPIAPLAPAWAQGGFGGRAGGEDRPQRAGTMACAICLPPHTCCIGLCKSKYSTRDLFLQGQGRLRGFRGRTRSSVLAGPWCRTRASPSRFRRLGQQAPFCGAAGYLLTCRGLHPIPRNRAFGAALSGFERVGAGPRGPWIAAGKKQLWDVGFATRSCDGVPQVPQPWHGRCSVTVQPAG